MSCCPPPLVQRPPSSPTAVNQDSSFQEAEQWSAFVESKEACAFRVCVGSKVCAWGGLFYFFIFFISMFSKEALRRRATEYLCPDPYLL